MGKMKRGRAPVISEDRLTNRAGVASRGDGHYEPPDGKVEVASTLSSRLRGLLGRGRYPHTLLLVPCNDVHTIGMRYSIDVAFVSPDGVVLRSHRNVEPLRRLRCLGAYATLERISSGLVWYEQGDAVDLGKMLMKSRRI